MTTCISDLNETILNEVLSYLTLMELNTSVRVASKFLKEACQIQKGYHFDQLSKAGSPVQIFGLLSEKGQSLNFKVGRVHTNQGLSNGRVPIKISHDLTGEEQTIAIKPFNLNIYPPKGLIKQMKKTSDFYTRDGKVRVPHGEVLHNVLVLSKWHYNIISGYAHYGGDFESFVRLPYTHHSMVATSGAMYTFWKVKPSLTGRLGELSVLDMNIIAMIRSEQILVANSGRKTKWKADGPNGELLVRNYVRFMQCWDTERIHGIFWVVKIAPSGSILVKLTDDNDISSLGQVYLVKGMATQVGENFPGLPGLCSTTILPIYNFLVYDGMCLGVPYHIDRAAKVKINDHIEKAINEGSVITQGKSSAQGLWDTEPPQLPKLGTDGETLDWSDVVDNSPYSSSSTSSNNGEFNFTEKQKEVAVEIAKLAKENGLCILFPQGDAPNSKESNCVTLRRFGYSKKENPDRICAILMKCQIIHVFSFQDELTYTLDEILKEILQVMKNLLGGKIPPIIRPDELAVVEPLQKLLNDSLQEVGTDRKVKVEWYPPPTEEETRNLNMVDAMP